MKGIGGLTELKRDRSAIAIARSNSKTGGGGGDLGNTVPDHVTNPSKQRSKIVLKFRLKINTNSSKISNDDSNVTTSVVGLGRNINGSEEAPPASTSSPTFKVDSLPVNVIKTQASQSQVAPTDHQPTKKKKKINEKKRRFCVTLSKEEIEEDIAKIERSKGWKRWRRPNEPDKKRPYYVQRQLDRLFPGFA